MFLCVSLQNVSDLGSPQFYVLLLPLIKIIFWHLLIPVLPNVRTVSLVCALIAFNVLSASIFPKIISSICALESSSLFSNVTYKCHFCFHLLQDFVVAHVFSAYYSQYPSVEPRFVASCFPFNCDCNLRHSFSYRMTDVAWQCITLIFVCNECFLFIKTFLFFGMFLFVPPMHIWISESRFYFSVKILPRFCFTFFHLLVICMLSVLFADNHAFCI